MQDFLHMAAEQLGVGEDKVAAASSGILDLLRQDCDADDLQKLLAELPGAEVLSQLPGSSGGFGGVAAGLGSALGARTGLAAGALGTLGETGLSGAQLGSLASMLVAYAKRHVDGALVDRLIAQTPGLRSFME